MEQTYNPISSEEFCRMMVGYPAELIEGYYIQDYHDGISLEDDHKTIKNCKSQSLKFDPLICGSIIFYNCLIDDLQFYDSSIDRIKIVNCQIKRLLFQDLKKNTEISISNNLQEGAPQRIEMIIVKGAQPNLSLANVFFTSLEIDTYNESIEGSLKIINCNQNTSAFVKVSGNIQSIVSENSIYSNFVVNKVNHPTIRFIEVQIKNKCTISARCLREVIFSQNTINILEINVSEIMYLSITDGSYNFILITGYLKKNLLIRKLISNTFKVDTISLTGTIIERDSNLILHELDLNNLLLNSLENNGSIQISDSTVNHSLEIIGSRMGHSQFSNISLSSLFKLKIYESSITACEFSSIDWTIEHRIYELDISDGMDVKKKTEYKRSIKEIYRQLKIVASKESNRFDEIMFQAHEQRLQKEILVLNNKKSDALLLQIHHFINEYNLNYWKPIRLLFLTHTILFILGLSFSESLKFEIWSFWKGFSSKQFWDCVGTYLMTMFPFHSRDYMADGDGIIKIIDTLMTLASGVFLFYFALATRKFHVKG